jgi:hypothetical protein
MNKMIWGAIAFTTVLAFHAPANATITVLGEGVLSIAAPTETFDGRALAPAVFNPGGDGGNYLGSGNVLNGSIDSVSAAPFWGDPYPSGRDPTNYLTIGPGNDPETITYSTPRKLFGLYWGSIDKYNTIDFYLGGFLIAGGSFTGADIIPLLPNGDQNDFHSNRYVVFTNIVFDKVVLGSSGPPGFVSTPAFEIDNIATAVPEPATWVLMLLGFAGIGFAAYRRTRNGSAAIAAA